MPATSQHPPTWPGDVGDSPARPDRRLDRRLAVGRLLLGLATAWLAACRPAPGLEDADPVRRAAAVEALPSRSEPRTLTALLVAEGDPSPAVRLAAVGALVRLGGQRGAEGLGPLLADADPAVVAAAARGLAALPPEAGGKARLLSGYAGASSAGRAAIAGALDQLGVSLREAVEAEAKLLWERNLALVERGSGQARAGAAEELGESGRSEAVTRLLGLLDGPARADVHLASGAALGLGATGARGARPRLEALLEGTARPAAEAAAIALGVLGDAGAADALATAAERGGPVASAAMASLEVLPTAPEVTAALCAVAVRSPDPERAAAAARLVTQRDQPCPVQPFLQRLGRPGEVAALAALAELRLAPGESEAAVRRVASALVNGASPEARAGAARALPVVGGVAVAGAISARLAEVSKRLQQTRAKAPFATGPDATELGGLLAASGRLKLPEAASALNDGLADPAPEVRAGTAEGIGLLGGPEAAAQLAPLLGDQVEAVRRQAARALARLGPPGAPALAQAATRSRPESVAWRNELARALGDTGGPEATLGLVALLEGPSAPVAAAAIGRLGAAAAARPLADRVGEPDVQGLPALLDALAGIGGVEIAPLIVPHLTSERADVREAAVRALGRLRYEAAASRLESLRSDYFGRVRRAAVEALARLPVRRPSARP